jgi:hypothetical protein
MTAQEVWENEELWSLVHNPILNAVGFVPMIIEMIEILITVPC